MTSTTNRQSPKIVKKEALDRLMKLLAVEGISGREKDVARATTDLLLEAGCKKSWIRHDRAHERIGQDFEIGNLIVRLPGSPKRRREPRRLFMGHMDTVPLCRGAVPKKTRDRIVSAGNTALGGDNRTSLAALVTMVDTVLKAGLDHPPASILLTVGEEIGLLGARHVDVDDLGRPAMGFNVDGGAPARVVIGATGADRWEVHVHGRSSHAGVHPEDGISSALIASRAIAEVADKGFFGKIEIGKNRGTSNVGVVRGGEATNQVTDYVFVRGESRSHNKAFLARITSTYRKAFEKAAKATRNSSGTSGSVDFRAETDYEAFKMPLSSPPIKLTLAAARRVGLEPETVVANGGLDANYLNARGIPTVTLGAGQHNPHTVDEYVDLSEFYDGCQLLTEIMIA